MPAQISKALRDSDADKSQDKFTARRNTKYPMGKLCLVGSTVQGALLCPMISQVEI